MPMLVEAGEAKEVAILPGEAILDLRTRVALPLEEGAGRNEAALEAQRLLERWLALDALSAGVDQLGANAWIFAQAGTSPHFICDNTRSVCSTTTGCVGRTSPLSGIGSRC